MIAAVVLQKLDERWCGPDAHIPISPVSPMHRDFTQSLPVPEDSTPVYHSHIRERIGLVYFATRIV